MKKIVLWLALIHAVMLCAGCAHSQSVTRVVIESRVVPPTYEPTVVARVEMDILGSR